MRVAVLGGGTMGLVLAQRIQRAGHDTVVLEAGSQIGGLSTWFDYGEFTWDKYYHVILRQDEKLLGLIDELGIGEHVRWIETKSGFLWRKRLLSMSNNWEFLTFPVLNLFQKVRLGLGILYCQTIKDPTPLEEITAAEWMRGIFGRRVYEAIWEPLLLSKYGSLTDVIPATIMWSTITRYYSTRSKGDGKETMGYLGGGGLRVLFEALERAIADAGGRIETDQRVEGLSHDGEGLRLRVAGSEGGAPKTLEFDRVISTLPTRALEQIAPTMPELATHRREPPRFLGVIRVALLLKRPLSPYYVTNLIQKGFPFTGIIEVSSLVERSEFAGRSLVMLPRYEVPSSDYFDRAEDEIAAEFVDALEPIWPDIRDNLIDTFVHRERIVQAIWLSSPPDADANQAPTSEDGRVWSVNAELAGRDTLNNNAVVGVATRAAEAFLRENPVNT